MQWGSLGQEFDYTTWVGNGPSFDSSLPQPVVGQAFNPVTNISLSTSGKAFGTRLRFYPFPLESNLGRLELGASTYDGKWQNGLWFNSWSVDYAYLNGNLQTRGEYVQTYRQMPANSSSDNRKAGMFKPGISYKDCRFRTFLLTSKTKSTSWSRWCAFRVLASGRSLQMRSRRVLRLGSTVLPSIFAPHGREVALELDY